LTQFKIIPIYRISEGAENLHKNEETFIISRKVLSHGNSMVIYPESICVQERRIRRLKKGAARIIFDLEEQHNFQSNLIILPLGMNYSNAKMFSSDLFIHYGEAISAAKYAGLYRSDKVKAINELTADIERAMKKLVVHINDKENDELVEDLYIIYKPLLMQELLLSNNNLEDDFKASHAIVNCVNYFQETDSKKIGEIKTELANYKTSLSNLNLGFLPLSKTMLASLSYRKIIPTILKLLIGTPFYILGLIMNYPPYKLGHTLAKKLTKEVEFHASIYLSIAWISWIFYFLLQLIVATLFFDTWQLVVVYAITIPITGIFVLRFHPILKNVMENIKLMRLKKKNKVEFDNVILHYEKLVQLINTAKEKYCLYLKEKDS